mmetsp:Transcript_61335/g.200555  ORF Transcript_61335/g.200555 Transcript_61335/m.200555 type:complete len:205 (+) Transcript_61335:259-873(+)
MSRRSFLYPCSPAVRRSPRSATSCRKVQMSCPTLKWEAPKTLRTPAAGMLTRPHLLPREAAPMAARPSPGPPPNPGAALSSDLGAWARPPPVGEGLPLRAGAAPPLRGRLAQQLAMQADGIKDMCRVVADLTTRMDAVAPRMQPLPVVLRELTQDVASIKTRLDDIAESGGRAERSGTSTPSAFAPPKRAPREVRGCFAKSSVL